MIFLSELFHLVLYRSEKVVIFFCACLNNTDGKIEAICHKKYIYHWNYLFSQATVHLFKSITHANLIVIAQMYITAYNVTFHLLYSIWNPTWSVLVGKYHIFSSLHRLVLVQAVSTQVVPTPSHKLLKCDVSMSTEKENKQMLSTFLLQCKKG